jgi:predicted RNase H-like HicB family nuclease
MTEIRVVFTPGDGGWLIAAPDVRGCHTWGRSISEARARIREALATCIDVFADADAVARDATLKEEYRLPREMRAAVQRFERARDAAAKVKAEQAGAARAITGTLSLRDAGELLGISQEGVRQLLKTG